MQVRLLGQITSTKKHQRSVPQTDRAAAIVTSLIKDREPEDVVFDPNYWTIGTRFRPSKSFDGARGRQAICVSHFASYLCVQG